MADNIRVRNMYYMLSYAYQTLRETGTGDMAAEDFENIHDLFAAILIQGIGKQIKRGLHRDYVSHEDPLTLLRGKMLLSESIKQQTLASRKMVCSFDDFTVDTIHNQILKSAILLLLRYGTVRSDNKKHLRKILFYLSGVSDISPGSIRWDTLKYHKNNASYRMILNVCRLVLDGLLLTNDTGSYRLSKWIDDEYMHKLYERFVLAYYQREHPSLNPRSAFIYWDVAKGTDTMYLPLMKTDITLQYGNKTLIIDTKWYGHTMQRIYSSTTYISSNLYQIYAYVKNYDKNATGNVAGTLLYAKTDETETPDKEFLIGGNQISLKTLDLDKEWRCITEQLDTICSWLIVQ